jgi:basic membrane protein A and related proteins
MKQRKYLIFLIVLFFVLSGCSTKSTQAPRHMRVGMVIDTAGLNDYFFNHSAHMGLIKAMQELDCDIKIPVSKTDADYEKNIRGLAGSGYDLIIAVGYLLEEPLKKVAKENPDVKFAIIDGNPTDLPNVAVYKFNEEEGSFLVGVMASTLSNKKKIAFIGGMKSPIIERFEAGYIAGARTANPGISVLVDYANSFDDPMVGKTLANRQIQEGADIIYHASGNTGIGVIDAIREKGVGYYAIGVDSDQDSLAPSRVLTSMIKRVDVAVFDCVKAVKEGRFKGGLTILGLKDDGIALSTMIYTKDVIVARDGNLLPEIDNLISLIKSGKIQVPDTLEKLKEFKAPKDKDWR